MNKLIYPRTKYNIVDYTISLTYFYGLDSQERAVLGMEISKTPMNLKADFKMVSMLRIIMGTEMMIEKWPDVVDNGQIYVMDYSGFNMDLMMYWNDVKFNKLHMKITFGALPVKVKKIIIVNQPALFTTFFNLVKIFFSKKVTDRVMQ